MARSLNRITAYVSGSTAPLVLGVVYLAAILFVGLKFHVMADGDSETDFLAAYVPQARSFLDGTIAIDPYRGPVYPMVLGTLSVLLRPLGLGFFESGIVLSALSAASMLALVQTLLKKLLDPLAALATTLLVVANPVFFRYSYTAGNDMFFAALATLVVFLVLGSKRPGRRRLIAAGAVAALTYLTRYNGAAVVFAALTCIVFVSPGRLVWKERFLGAVVFFVIFGALIVPWGIYTLAERGVFLYNQNHINVAVSFHSADQPPEYFRAANEGRFHNYVDVVMYDPAGFFSRIPRHAWTYFVQMLKQVTGGPIGVLFVLGIVLSALRRPTRGQLGYYVFGITFFGLLCLVFYNNRFLLFMIPMLMMVSVLAVFTMGSLITSAKVRQAVSVVIVAGLVFYNGAYSIAYNKREVAGGDIAFRRMGERFQREFPNERGRRVVARKPFFAYFAGLEFVHMPVVQSVDDLVQHARASEADYLLFSFIAARTRPMVASLLDPNVAPPGLKVVAIHRDVGVLYRVDRAE